MPDMKTLTIDGTKFDVVDAKAVHFTEQTLTEEQKARARENIGVGVGSNVEPAEDDIPKVFFTGAAPTSKEQGELPLVMEYRSKTNNFTSYVTLKVQGNSSTMFPKKNFTIKLYSDASYNTKMKKSFKGWGEQNKYVLKANYIDLTHSRNVVCARLWADCVKSRPDYETLPELLRTSPNQGAVDGFIVKVYFNGVYHGRYTWNIPKDGWMANMDSDLDTHCILCGESNIDDRSLFRAEPSINESDWTDELHDSVPSSILTSWRNACASVYNTTDDEFKTAIYDHFDVPSLIDWVCFIYAIEGSDNSGKNQIFYTYDGIKWIVSLYDMDCTYGTWYDGSNRVIPYDYDAFTHYKTPGDESTATCNLLVERLKKLFYEDIQRRWAVLTGKDGALGYANVFNRFEQFIELSPPELVNEDYAETTANGAHTGIPYQGINNIQQIRQFALNRTYFASQEIDNLSNNNPDVPIDTTWDYGKVDITTGAITESTTRLITTDFVPDNVEVVSCTSGYKCAAVCYDSNGNYLGYYINHINTNGEYDSIYSEYVTSNSDIQPSMVFFSELNLANVRRLCNKVKISFLKVDSTNINISETSNITMTTGMTDAIWRVGAINGYDGIHVSNHTNRIYTWSVIPHSVTTVTAAAGYKIIAACWNNGSFKNYYNPNTDGFTDNGGNCYAQTIDMTTIINLGYFARIMVKRDDNADMTVNEGINIIFG